MQIRLLLIGLLGAYSFIASAQSIRRMSYAVELGGLATTPEQTPFFLRANQYGTVPLQGSYGTLRLSAARQYRAASDTIARPKSRFDWGFSFNAVANGQFTTGTHNPAFLLPEAFVKIKWGKVELFGGNRREVMGIGDTLLTSGFIAWSGNALPFPKIQLHTPDYVELGFTKKLLAFRAGYAHGWFANSYIQGSYLHQKYLYVRLGKPHWALRFYGGINHQVQWGGRADYLIGTPLAVNGNLPTSFQDYMSMIIGHYPDALQNDRFTDFDGTNRIGNHIGNYDLAVEWRQSKQHWLLYHQHLYEDASGLALQNVPDGLTGLRYLTRHDKNARFRVQRWVVEWLSTTNQSGPTFDPTARYQGADNYFNHSQYREGWSYKGRTIGTPFIMPYYELAPAVSGLGGSFYPNNRLVAWYTGLEAAFRQGPVLTMRLSYSRNFGAYSQPYPQVFHQFSTQLAARYQLPGCPGTLLTTSLALDQGDLLPHSLGGFVSLRKNW